MTDIVPAPAVRLSSEFPTNADRAAGVFNTKSNSWAITSRTMAADTDAAAKSAETNAIAANERSVSSSASAGDALTQANRAQAEANAAMGYRDTASTHATTATTQAGIATTKAGEAAASASQASTQKDLAQQAVADATEQVGLATAQAVRAEEAAASISDGPVTSVNGKTGVVSLTATDIAAAATEAEMQAGVEAGFRSLSPLRVKEAVLAHAPNSIERNARTSNVQLAKADSGKWIDITSGTFTQTFAAAATLGNGWWCYLQNSGTGDITIPASDGRTNWIMYPGECRLVQCDGTALRSVVLNSFYKVFAASGNFINPPGYMAFEGYLIGGGGAGAAGINSGADQQYCLGGKNAYSTYFSLIAPGVAASSSVVIGSGGSSSTTATNNTTIAGGAGGTSSFEGISASGGSGGLSANSPQSSAPLNTLSTFPYGTTNGEANATGYGGTSGASANTVVVPACGGGADTFSSAYSGGTSKLCGSAGNGRGQDGSGTLVGYSASGYGCGGGATVIRNLNAVSSSATSGAGGSGALIIWGII